jgi:hypothetical protein
MLTAFAHNTAELWDIGDIPLGDIFYIACVWLPDQDFTEIARDYDLTDLTLIRQGDPPLPDLIGK